MKHPHNDPVTELAEIKNLIHALEERMADTKEQTNAGALISEINRIEVRLFHMKKMFAPLSKAA